MEHRLLNYVKPFLVLLLSVPGSSVTLPAISAEDKPVVLGAETIAFVRHGEKPKEEFGQINCQGLNRALALPAVIKKAFGAPDAIFAPNPSDDREDFDYLRPLATIEPTAIAFGKPVNTRIAFYDTNRLVTALEDPTRRDSLVLVAWEGRKIAEAARKLLNDNGGDPSKVKDWDAGDFDSIYVVTIDWARGKADFEQKSEGLNGQPESCPQ
jgi:hypothetical protein